MKQTKIEEAKNLRLISKRELRIICFAVAFFSYFAGWASAAWQFNEPRTVECSKSIIDNAKKLNITLLDECDIGWRPNLSLIEGEKHE